MPSSLEFSIIFPAPPEVFAFLLTLLLVLMIYWAVKWVVSIYTGA
jgi:hypothetical protein